MTTETRELWLQQAVNLFRPHFGALHYPIPEKVRVACGWPSKNALGMKKRRLGECWASTTSADGVPHIYISPLIHEDVQALDVLAHELVHACLPPEAGHKRPFVKACNAIGLTEGKPEYRSAGPEFLDQLRRFAVTLGEYPQAEVVLATKEKKQTCRQLKIVCDGSHGDELHEAYILRGAKKTLERGLPACPVCGAPMEMEQTDGEEAEGE